MALFRACRHKGSSNRGEPNSDRHYRPRHQRGLALPVGVPIGAILMPTWDVRFPPQADKPIGAVASEGSRHRTFEAQRADDQNASFPTARQLARSDFAAAKSPFGSYSVLTKV